MLLLGLLLTTLLSYAVVGVVTNNLFHVGSFGLGKIDFRKDLNSNCLDHMPCVDLVGDNTNNGSGSLMRCKRALARSLYRCYI